ncbi:CPBP family intramembrane glutamic endopeptidase [Catalinimonas niigatensis]|uniref:CPBP family intramembrane glutamic endopeptidase n=1 Tax=Catalinimonas niigatensis TaxID=1397264 RepID=UPI0026668EC3|nr:CPBP family intramembrane glutamic endopeptidase [Catalinimonas niigatensis]WPP48171.1 CPBP family intramembrane glutamic endopeptidase [Catalinimonas niigatensis]
MPHDVVSLSKEQIRQIKEKIGQEGVVTPELVEELVDHFCVAIEEEMKGGRTFESAFDKVFDNLQEDELKVTEMKTKELTEGKTIFYPDLLQSFLMVLAAFLISWVVSLTVQAIALGEENVEVRAQWFNQNFLWIGLLNGLLTLGAPLAYAIWKRKKISAHAPVFSFCSVPFYVYGMILPIVVFSWFWLEPLAIFSPFFKDIRSAYISQLEGFSPLLLTLITIIIIVLGELLFRGIILKGLLMTMTPLRAILWSSLFYALTSYPYFITRFITGILLGWLYWKTRSLYPTIFLMVIGIIIPYVVLPFVNHSKDFFFHFSWWEFFDKNLMIYVPLIISSLLVTAGLFNYLRKKLNT